MNRHKILEPNVERGGQAIPLGNNLYYMRGRKHEQGGIHIGKDLEVEGGEVIKTSPHGVKVYSSLPILNGQSPAQRVMQGENTTAVFNAQQQFKRVNRLKDDGTKMRVGGLKEKVKSKGKTLTRNTGVPFILNPIGYGITKIVKHFFSDKQNAESNDTNNTNNSNTTNKGVVATKNMTRVRQNTSPTKERSSAYEDSELKQYKDEDVKFRRKGFGKSLDKSIILYEEDKVRNFSDNAYRYIPTNVLDTLAKYGGRNGTSIEESVGLGRESAWGRNLFHNTYDAAMKNKRQREALKLMTISKEEYDRQLGNASFIKSFNQVNAHNLVRDYDYINSKDKNMHPLDHAYQKYNRGDYNRGEPNHTPNTIAAGKELLNTKEGKRWLRESGNYWYNVGVNERNK